MITSWFLCCHVGTDTESFYTKIFLPGPSWKVPVRCRAMSCCAVSGEFRFILFRKPGSQRESKGVKGSQRESKGVKGSQRESKGVKEVKVLLCFCFEWATDSKVCPAEEVNMKFFDMFKKPVDFFPHKLQAMDTGLDLQS